MLMTEGEGRAEFLLDGVGGGEQIARWCCHEASCSTDLLPLDVWTGKGCPEKERQEKSVWGGWGDHRCAV